MHAVESQDEKLTLIYQAALTFSRQMTDKPMKYKSIRADGYVLEKCQIMDAIL